MLSTSSTTTCISLLITLPVSTSLLLGFRHPSLANSLNATMATRPVPRQTVIEGKISTGLSSQNKTDAVLELEQPDNLNSPTVEPQSAPGSPDANEQPHTHPSEEQLLPSGIPPTEQLLPPGSMSEDLLSPDQPIITEPTLYPLDDYRLTVGDIIYVIVTNIPDYSGTFQVMPDGSLTLPVLDPVMVWGKTLAETEEAIAQAYEISEVLVEPSISVTISQISPLRVAILGEVSRPGSYTLSPYQGKLPTLSEALSTAGGITQRTDIQSIEVRRIRPDNREADIISISLWDVLAQGDLNQDIPLRDGDVILVPEAEPIPIPTARELASSSYSSGTIQINIVGEVNAPGIMEVPADTPLTEALLLAGNLNRRSRNKVQILRLNPDGTVTHRDVPVDIHSDINHETNPILQDRDVVLVGKNWSASLIETVDGILQPFNAVTSVLNLFLPFLF